MKTERRRRQIFALEISSLERSFTLIGTTHFVVGVVGQYIRSRANEREKERDL